MQGKKQAMAVIEAMKQAIESVAVEAAKAMVLVTSEEDNTQRIKKVQQRPPDVEKDPSYDN